MAEARPSGEHQAAGAPNAGNVTQTGATELSILLFNVSGAFKNKRMSEAQNEGIQLVLESEELALDRSSTFIFCSDEITKTKKLAFNNKLQTSSPTRNTNAAIFYNQMAKYHFSPDDILDVPLLPAHLKLRQQHVKAIKEHIEKLEKYINKWSKENQTPGTQDELRDAQQLCQSTLSLFNSSSCELTPQFHNDCLGRVAVTLTKCLHNDRRILLASWHGRHKKPKNIKIKYLQDLIHFIEDLRKYYQMDVAVLGGDFNLDTDSTRDSIENLRSQLQGITLFPFSDKKAMYTVVWPEGHLEQQPDFPKEIHPEFPTVTVKDKELERFDHPILLYRFAIKLPETKERENERERERERRAGQAYDVGTEERGAVMAEVEEEVGRDDEQEEVDEKEEEEEETDEEEEGVEEEEEAGVDEEEEFNILFSEDCSLG